MAISRLTQTSLQNAFQKYNSLWDGRSAVGSMDAIGTSLVATSGSITTISFTNIPQTYTHLQLRVSAIESTQDAYFQAVYNSDTTQTNYPRHEVRGNGSAASAASTINVDATTKGAMIGLPGYSSTSPGVGIVDILDYTNTNKYKTTRSLFGQDANGSGLIALHSSVWLSTAAITQIDFRCNLAGGSSASSKLIAGSIVSLYGIK